METEKILEKAMRLKLRFRSGGSTVTTEDLWSIDLLPKRPDDQNLNDIAKDIARQLKDSQGIDFVDAKPNKETRILELKLEILKYIISVKQEEKNKRKEITDRREKRKRLIDLIAKKEEKELEEKDITELRSMLAAEESDDMLLENEGAII